MNSTALNYRKTALEGASGFGLMIALFDTVAGNLRRAAEAERNNDIEKRCLEVNHAALVLAHLEDWVDSAGGGDLALELIGFYSSLRRNLIAAQAKRSVELLEQQMELVLSVRKIWQEMELRGSGLPGVLRHEGNPTGPVAASMQDLPTSSSWAA